METGNKFYRYEAVQYADIDRDGDYVSPMFPNPTIELRTYNLWKETPKGCWIGYGSMSDGKLRSMGRWISKTSRRRYAYPTKKEALENFVKRTEKRIQILTWQLDICKSAISKAIHLKID